MCNHFKYEQIHPISGQTYKSGKQGIMADKKLPENKRLRRCLFYYTFNFVNITQMLPFQAFF